MRVTRFACAVNKVLVSNQLTRNPSAASRNACKAASCTFISGFPDPLALVLALAPSFWFSFSAVTCCKSSRTSRWKGNNGMECSHSRLYCSARSWPRRWARDVDGDWARGWDCEEGAEGPGGDCDRDWRLLMAAAIRLIPPLPIPWPTLSL